MPLALRRYRNLLGAPGVAAVVASAILGRLPLGMGSLLIVLLARHAGRSYGTAGALVAAYTVSIALSGPVLGRLVDRVGQPRVLLPLAFAYPGTLVALSVVAAANGPTGAMAACAIAAGAVTPPLGACVRALWPALARTDELRATAFAFEATVQEIVFVCGPLATAGIAAFASPVLAGFVAAACGAAGTLSFAATPAARSAARHPAGGHGRFGPLGASGVRTILLVTMAMGATFGVIEVAMPAFGELHGDRAAGGLALSCYALGSLLGGVAAGSLPHARRPAARYVAALTALALALVLPLLAGSIGAMCVLVLAAGLPIAPTFALAYGLMDRLAPRGTATEAFGWFSTAIVVGSAGGTAIAGAVIDGPGVRAAIVVALAAGVVAAVVATARRATLA